MILRSFATPLAVAYLFFTIFYEAGDPRFSRHSLPIESATWAIFSSH